MEIDDIIGELNGIIVEGTYTDDSLNIYSGFGVVEYPIFKNY